MDKYGKTHGKHGKYGKIIVKPMVKSRLVKFMIDKSIIQFK